MLIKINRRSRYLLRDIIVEDASGNDIKVPNEALSVEIDGAAPLKVRDTILAHMRLGEHPKPARNRPVEGEGGLVGGEVGGLSRVGE